MSAAHDPDLASALHTGLAVCLVESSGCARPHRGGVWHRHADQHSRLVPQALGLHAATSHPLRLGAKALGRAALDAGGLHLHPRQTVSFSALNAITCFETYRRCFSSKYFLIGLFHLIDFRSLIECLFLLLTCTYFSRCTHFWLGTPPLNASVLLHHKKKKPPHPHPDPVQVEVWRAGWSVSLAPVLGRSCPAVPWPCA